MERKWVVTAYIDITGFRRWTYRAATAPEIKERFLTEFYKVLQCYVKNRLDAWSKYEGDGLLTIKEFTPDMRTDGKSIGEFVVGLRGLYRKVRRVLSEAEEPPEGVRIRMMTGYVFKLMVLDPNDPERKRLIPEFVEYCTNTLRGLLDVNPEIPALATSTLGKNLGTARSSLRVRPLKKPSTYPKGVNPEDVDGLMILNF